MAYSALDILNTCSNKKLALFGLGGLETHGQEKCGVLFCLKGLPKYGHWKECLWPWSPSLILPSFGRGCMVMTRRVTQFWLQSCLGNLIGFSLGRGRWPPHQGLRHFSIPLLLVHCTTLHLLSKERLGSISFHKER